MLGKNLKKVIEFRIEGVLFTGLLHPCDMKRPSSRNNRQDPRVGPECRKSFTVYSAMEGEKVYSLPAVFADNIKEEVGTQICGTSCPPHGLIDRNGANRNVK